MAGTRGEAAGLRAEVAGLRAEVAELARELAAHRACLDEVYAAGVRRGERAPLLRAVPAAQGGRAGARPGGRWSAPRTARLPGGAA